MVSDICGLPVCRRGEDMSASIIFDQSRLKVYDGLTRLCEYAGETGEWCNVLWSEMLVDQQLYDAFVYYLEHHGLPESPKCAGYSLTDCYVWEVEQDNLRRDTGKNTAQCNKEDMVLHAFMTMAKMKRSPEEFVRRFRDGRGMDQTM